ncbi:MAG: hypothetical protein HYW33_03300 [Candidatus Blackburnbacteria bacterium]|nr:hypothetical protein [Candidatus Blackburnbacteria bacterium]
MNLFGCRVNINLSNFPEPTSLQERLGVQLIKRDTERTIFNDFLNSRLRLGCTIFEDMQRRAEESMSGKASQVDQATLSDFIVQELKARRNGTYSAYDHLVFDSMQALDSRAHTVQIALQNKKLAPQNVPAFYPGLRNKTEGLLKAKIREGLGDKEYDLFARREAVVRLLKEMSQEMFYGINKLGLNGESLQRYLRVLYLMGTLEVAPLERPGVLRQMVGKAIKDNVSLNLLTIKCLRFTYPYGNRLKLITSMDAEGVPSREGKIHYPLNEANYFDYLHEFSDIFTQEHIVLNTTVLVADLDLQDYFPDGKGHFVPDNDIQMAHEDIQKYTQNVQSRAGGGIVVLPLSRHLREHNLQQAYDQIRSLVMTDLLANKRTYLPEGIVETRVNYRYESNKKIFGIQNRNLARTRVCAQLASLFALQTLAGNITFLLAEDKGLENKLIGGKQKEGLPVVFVKLRDEA